MKKEKETKIDLEKFDPLLPYALKEVIKAGIASCTLVRRKLGIGFARSARLVDCMEELGFISSTSGGINRKVFLTVAGFEQLVNKKFDEIGEPPKDMIVNPSDYGVTDPKGESFGKNYDYFVRFAAFNNGHFTSEEINKLAKVILNMEPKEE